MAPPAAAKNKKRKGSEPAAPRPKKQRKSDGAPTAAARRKPRQSSEDPPSPPGAGAAQELVTLADGDEDDHTAALLAGFESDQDEDDLQQEDENFSEEAEPKLSKKQRLALEKAAKANEPGVVFVGRIPHGFFEPQMKRYFSQFGKINQLRLSRNKKTGASKHYAFIEFASADVAEIVAQTMNSYLMFGHVLQCKVVPPEQVHPDLFKGADERFKVDPRNKKAGLEMERGVDRQKWEKRIAAEIGRRHQKNRQLKQDFGYVFTTPTLKSVDQVPRKAHSLENGAVQQLLTEAPAGAMAAVEQSADSNPGQLSFTETVTLKNGRKGAQAKSAPAGDVETVEFECVQGKKSKKKNKERSTDAVKEFKEVQEESLGDESLIKAKKTEQDIPGKESVEEVTKVKKRQDGNSDQVLSTKSKNIKRTKKIKA